MSVVVVNVSSGSTTTTLPLISSVPGAMITIKDSGSASASNTITIVPTAGNTFEIGTYVINSPLGYITFLGIGTRWRVIASTYPNVPLYTSTVVTPGVLPPANATINILTAGQATLGNTTVASLAAGPTTLNTVSTIGQAAFFSSVQVQGGLSVFSSITARNINFTGILTSNGTTFTGGSAPGINSAGSIGINSASNASYSLLVTGNQSNTGTLQVAGATTLVNSSNTGTLGVAGLTTLSSNLVLPLGTVGVGVVSAHSFTTEPNLVNLINNAPTNGMGQTTGFPGLATWTASNQQPLQISGYNGINFVGGRGNWAEGASHMCVVDGLVGIRTRDPQQALDVSGNIRASGTLGVAGTTTLSNTSNTGTLGVAGTTTLSNTSNTGTLGVAGTTTLTNTSNTGTLGVAGTTTLTNTSNTGTLGVAGTTTLTNTSNTGTLGVAGTTTLTNTSNTGTLGVAGTTTLTNTSNTGTLGVAGATTLTNTSNTGTLGVAGYTTLSSNLTIGSGAAGSATLIRLNMNVGNINWSYLCATESLGDVSLAANCYTSNLLWYPVNTAGSYSFISTRQGAIKFWCGNNGSLPNNGTFPYVGAGATDSSLTATMSLTASGMTVTNTSNTGTLGVAGAVTFGGTLNTGNVTIGTASSAETRLSINTSNGTWVNFFPTVTGGGVSARAWDLFYYPGAGGILSVWSIQPQSNLFYTNLNFQTPSNITANRYEANGGSMPARTGGVFNRGNDGASSSYQSINWIPGPYESGSNWNRYDNGQGACGVVCSGQTGEARIEFFVINAPSGSNAPTRVGFFNSSGFSVNGDIRSSNINLITPSVGSWVINSVEDNTIKNRIWFSYANSGVGSATIYNAPFNSTASSNLSHIFRYNETDLMRIANNGTVNFTGSIGVGTSSPVCPLHVVSSNSFSQSASGYYYGGTVNTGVVPSAGTEPLSIKADHIIWTARHFLVQSDIRVKKNIIPVTDSLDIVNNLNVVSFDYIEYTNPSVKYGLIAQEVKEVCPDAVHRTTDYIPSVLRLATYEKTENVTIRTPIEHGFIVNDNIKMYINQDGNPDTRDFEYTTEVLEVLSATEFVVKPWDNFELGQDLFIYGKLVDDFLGIDKPLIGLIAAGACKVLSGQVTAQSSTITSLQTDSLTQSLTITSLQTDILTQSSTITSLQTNAEAQSSTITSLQTIIDSQASTITAILEKYPV